MPTIIAGASSGGAGGETSDWSLTDADVARSARFNGASAPRARFSAASPIRPGGGSFPWSPIAARRRPSGLARELPISRQAIQKHLASLEGANLVAATARGRERVYRATPAPLSEAVGWIADVGGEWDDRLAALRGHLAGRRRSHRGVDSQGR